jgi:squalene-hopene/tetraprenyl-beta-curcumene cyclase
MSDRQSVGLGIKPGLESSFAGGIAARFSPFAGVLREDTGVRGNRSKTAELDRVIADVRVALKASQADEGHWVYELEADATIPAEYILLEHFLDDIDPAVEAKLARYLRRTQGEHGGWPLFHAGDMDISATVKAYYALKLAGDDIHAPHMTRARTAILARGGASKANVFTRITLALFGQVPWHAVPTMPVEIMLLPQWFPFHLTKVSYWTRTVLAPLLVLFAKKPRAANPKGIGIAELFATPPFEERNYIVNPTGSRLGDGLIAFDRVLRQLVPLMPKMLERRAIDAAMAFVKERLNGEDGLGGIFPAMANAVMAFRTLGYPKDDPDYAIALASIRKLVADHGDSAYCQPCVSPVWDTALAMQALMEAGEPADSPTIRKAAEWLRDRQILDVKGDWEQARPGLRPGGWAFQDRNDYYPDTDDTAAVLIALERAGDATTCATISRGIEWILGMQSKNGGWGSFDADNTATYLNHIPFADHGALLDPPTADVSARCVGMLAQCGLPTTHPALRRGIDFLYGVQEEDGSWFGRWGTNYIYGTWSVLSALNAAGEDPNSPRIRKAVDWLVSRQLPDGGWGEDCTSYWPDRRGEVRGSTASQTAWALLGLMAAGAVDSEPVRRGIAYLVNAPRREEKWDEELYNAVGFPRVFFLRYHGYSRYFPLWALARYRWLTSGNSRTTPYAL